MVRHMRDLIESGRFRPVIDRHYPLDRIVDAHRLRGDRAEVGSVVIDEIPG